MICSNCGKHVYRAFSYTDSNGNWKKSECEACYPLGRINGSLSVTDKIKSRVRLPDGTVISGQRGIRARDNMRRAQDRAKHLT